MPVPDLPAVNYKGKLEKIDDKTIVLKLDDGRTASFERSRKTKFYKDSKEVKASALNLGDRVSVDATQDPQAFLDALRVSFDDSPPAVDEYNGSPSDSAQSSSPTIQYDENGRPTLRRRNAPAPEHARSPESGGAGPPSTLPPQSDDNGRPTLRKRNATEPEPMGSRESASADLPASPFPSAGGRMETSPLQDPFIEKARGATTSSSDPLPDFTCQEVIARSTRSSNESNWEPIDVVSAEVVYEDGKESRRNVKINDRAAGEEALSGAWLIGKLIGNLGDLFSPATAARFQFGGETNLPNLQARLYDFEVAMENSQWIMRLGAQSISAAYRGSVWIDKESGRVLRLEMQAHDLPEGFPVEKVETDAEYAVLRIGEKSALWPVHVETMGCQRGTETCTRNITDFKNYRVPIADSKDSKTGPIPNQVQPQ